MDRNSITHGSDEFKECDICGRILPKRYDKSICPSCEENALFSQVKDYIRSNDVNEYQVANHFHIPLRQVKAWIREGRIEYKDGSNDRIMSHCQKCGAPISFGSLCPKCLKLLNGNKGYAVGNSAPSSGGGTMRFMDEQRRR